MFLRMSLRLAALLLLGAASAALLPMSAALAQPEAQAEAKAHTLFETGREAYDHGRFTEALALYEQAYRLSPRPGMLFNIGRAAEADSDYVRAIEAYERYLREAPQADNREFVAARLNRLRASHAPPTSGQRDPSASAESSRPSSAEPARGSGATWTADDETWFQRNRAFRIAGRVMAGFGGVLILAGLSAGREETFDEYYGDYYDEYSDKAINTIFAGVGFYGLGSLVWAASTSRGTNEMRRRGARISKVAAILSVVGLLAPPMLWIAGPMAGANMRRAHDDVTRGATQSAADRLPSLQYRVNF